jgi:uncharacterized protein YifN (PemK superfamily)
MAITHIPAAGDVLMCEFGPDPASITAPGVMKGPLAVPPEIFKYRPVAVLSTIDKLSIVVPFSTSQPRYTRASHVHVPVGTYRFLTGAGDSWLKADLIEAVSHARLDRLRIGGVYQRATLTRDHLKDLRAACLNALQLGRLASSL